MRITSKGVTFEGCYGSNTNMLAGRIHFTDDTMVDVYLHPSILAMLIGICAHDLKLESPDIIKIIRRLHQLGDDYTRRLNAEKLIEAWKQAAPDDQSQLCRSHLKKEKDNGRVPERRRPVKRDVATKKRDADKRNRSKRA